MLWQEYKPAAAARLLRNLYPIPLVMATCFRTRPTQVSEDRSPGLLAALLSVSAKDPK